MATKQSIAIIGASGNMGSALAKSLAGTNYRLLLIANQNEKVRQLIDEIKAVRPGADMESMTCSFDASWEADIIIPAVPYRAEKEVAQKIREVATQKIVLSISNPINENYDGPATPAGISAAEELQKLLPYSKVIKSFNTVFANDFLQPVIAGKQTDCFIAGNEKESLQTVFMMVATAGFTPIIAGDLTQSRALESRMVSLICDKMKNNPNRTATYKIVHS